ncbi:MAG: hypothetical protein ACTS3F_14640 [Phycisphaerales bacterium]
MSAGRSDAMHPGWWAFFVFLGVLVAVGLVVSIVQGMWFYFGVIVVGCVALGMWGLWEARLRPDWRRVVLSDAVPSDQVVRSAAVERIREARGDGEKQDGWWNRLIGMAWLVGGVGLVAVWMLGFTMQAVMLVLLLLGSGLSAWLVCRGVWWLGRRSRWGWVLGVDADDAEGVEGGGGDAEAREEARLLAWATARAVHRRAVMASRNGMMLMVLALLFVLGYSALLAASGAALPTGLVAAMGQFVGWMLMLPLVLMGVELLQHTDGERRNAVRESERLMYGEAARVPGWRRGRDEMESLVRAHRASKGGEA